MKNKNLVRATFALAAAALIGGGIIAAQAASSDTAFANRRAEAPLNASQLETRAERQAQMEANRTASLAAIEAGDYNAWKEAVGENNPFADKITAENFSKFVEAHNLRMQADSIMAELGIDMPQGHGAQRQGRGIHRMAQ